MTGRAVPARTLARLVAPVLIVLQVLWLGASTAGAQGDEIQLLDLDSRRSPEIELTVALPDRFAAASLDDQSFTVVEGGTAVPVQATPLGSSLDIALVVDTSGSMNGAAMPAAKAAATQFLQQLDPTARVAVVGFGATPTVASPLSTDRAASQAAVDALTPRGETALWDALVLAASLRQDRDLHIVLLSDGGDTVSTATAEQAVSALKDAGAPLYALSLNTGESDRAGLDAIVGQVGGLSLSAEDPAALSSLYQQVATRLSTLWTLRFQAVGSGSERLELTVDDGTGPATVSRDVTLRAYAPRTATPPTTTPVVSPPPSTVVASGPGVLSSKVVLWAGLGLMAIALLITGLVVAWPGVPKLRLSNPVGDEGELRRRVLDVADRAISAERRGRLELALEEADSDLRPAEVVAGAAVATVAAALLFFILGGPILALAALAVPVVARVWLTRKASKRRKKFADQLPATLLMLSASLRSGRALTQALESLAKESPEPTGSEISRVVIEARIGRDLVDGLERVAERMGSTDFEWVVRAIAVSRELGGDLAEILDRVSDTIRDRAQIQRQVRSLSAEGRMSAWILMGLPVFVGLVVSKTNGDYLNLLFSNNFGRVLIGLGLFSFAAGGAWIRRIVNLRY